MRLNYMFRSIHSVLHKTRYRIVSVEEQEDASIIVRVRKHLNDKTDVSEYFN